jgi:hypothetical protein
VFITSFCYHCQCCRTRICRELPPEFCPQVQRLFFHEFEPTEKRGSAYPVLPVHHGKRKGTNYVAGIGSADGIPLRTCLFSSNRGLISVPFCGTGLVRGQTGSDAKRQQKQ